MHAVIALVFFALGTVVGALVVRWRCRRFEDEVTRSIDRIGSVVLDLLQKSRAGLSSDVSCALDCLARAVTDLQEVHSREIDRLAEFQRALDSIPWGVVLVDHRGDPVFRNSFAAAFEGARHGEALVAGAVDELLENALLGVHDTRPLELFGPPRRALVITTFPLYSDERLVGAIALIEDVTERRRLDVVRRDFVANISHELKTPVGALTLLAETLADEEDPEVSRRLAERMLSEALRVNRTIEDLLELTRIENEEEPIRESLLVSHILAEAADRIKPAAQQRGIPVVLREIDERLTVLGDRRQLVSAVFNLLDNAIKYSDSDSPVEVSALTDGRFIEISVQDHGIGIPAKDLERIFERFYRVDQGRSRQTGGTGLGLAIVRHVASNHQGEVRVESRLGHGSTFTLSLPSASDRVFLNDHSREELRESRPARVL